jgi:hypothetical protein
LELKNNTMTARLHKRHTLDCLAQKVYVTGSTFGLADPDGVRRLLLHFCIEKNRIYDKNAIKKPDPA